MKGRTYESAGKTPSGPEEKAQPFEPWVLSEYGNGSWQVQDNSDAGGSQHLRRTGGQDGPDP